MQCYTVTSDLVQRGIIKPKVHAAIVTCLLRWIEREPMHLFRRHAESLVELVAVEPTVLPQLRRRLGRRAGQAFRGKGQFAGFAQLVFQLEALGLPVVDDEPGNEVLDHPTASMMPPLQLGLLQTLRSMLRDWPVDRLADELTGPALDLLCCRKGLKEKATSNISVRISEELNAIRDKVLARAEPVRVQIVLLAYGRFLCATAGAAGGKVSGNGRGLVDLAEPLRMHLLASQETLGSLGFCTASVTPGAKELPPEYLGRKVELYERLGDLWKMVAQVMQLLGDDDESAVARTLLEPLQPVRAP